MKGFCIAWDWPALATFYKLPLHTATTLDHAVVRLAERGDGQVEWDPPYYLLHAGFHVLLLSIDKEQRTITVLRIYRSR